MPDRRSYQLAHAIDIAREVVEHFLLCHRIPGFDACVEIGDASDRGIALRKLTGENCLKSASYVHD
jgi:hypothetical protein